MGNFLHASDSNVMNNAKSKGIVIPEFNIPYVPIMELVIKTLIKTRTFGLIIAVRLE